MQKSQISDDGPGQPEANLKRPDLRLVHVSLQVSDEQRPRGRGDVFEGESPDERVIVVAEWPMKAWKRKIF